MTTQVELGEFQGRMITKTTIVVKRAGDGLSKAQKVDPMKLRQGDTVFVVLEATVGAIHYRPIEDRFEEECFDLVTQAATMIDEAAVHDALALTKERIAREEERDAGVSRLPTDQELHGQHYLGEHADGLVKGCPDCLAEQDAVAAESGDGKD